MKIIRIPLLASLLATLPAILSAQDVTKSWLVETEQSVVTATHVKGDGVAETTFFRDVSGLVSPSGQFQISINLKTVDSGVEIRDTRLNFLFFETFNYPNLLVEGQIDPILLADMRVGQRMTVEVPVKLNVLGREVSLVKPVSVALHVRSSTDVSITSFSPVLLKLEDLGLLTGLEKLEEAASVDVQPVAIIDLDISMKPDSTLSGETPLTISSAGGSCDRVAANIVAISEADVVSFASSSTEITGSSWSILQNMADIMRGCETMIIEIGGHTDSFGSSALNMRLSQQRAIAVVAALSDMGVRPTQMLPVGYGESLPIASNTTERGRERNRRIEFKAL